MTYLRLRFVSLSFIINYDASDSAQKLLVLTRAIALYGDYYWLTGSYSAGSFKPQFNITKAIFNLANNYGYSHPYNR